jgi:hypothetical protein
VPVCGHHLHVPVHDAWDVIDAQLRVPEVQSESPEAPCGQHPSPLKDWVISVCLHVAAHVPALSHVSLVQESVSLHWLWAVQAGVHV